jgi:hypothetical protein
VATDPWALGIRTGNRRVGGGAGRPHGPQNGPVRDCHVRGGR